ncbi:MAG: glycosyltransferase family 4 protein [Cyanobacteria bacterium SBLK]|nr:glycosyltransferase family 4 protein [Cyanobacteria bacterium SBLK]
MTQKPKLLIVGDGGTPTGFARIIRSIFKRLDQKYDIHHLAVGYAGDPHDYSWKLYAAGSGGDLFGCNRLSKLVEVIRPALILFLNDIWLLGSYMDALPNREIPAIGCCTIESRGLNPNIVLKLSKMCKLVVFTQFAKRELSNAIARCQRIRFPNDFLETIPLGVDTENFFPFDSESRMSAKQNAKSLLLGHEVEPESFWVLNANRNQPRKRIDLTIRGFARFAANKSPHVKLCLHMGLKDLGWNIAELGARFGIEDRLIFTTTESNSPNMSDIELNLIYNACDAGLNTSTSEGWGMVAFEHAATGTAQILPKHTSCEELWQDSALLIDPVLSLIDTSPIALEEHLIAPNDIADALETLYGNRETLNKLARQAYKNATKPEYHWDRIAELWDRLLRQTIDSQSASR